MFVLVRHAHAGDKKEWAGVDAHRPLSDLGQRQALGLVCPLGRLDIRTVWSSPTARCRQTVTPLARELALPVQDQEPLLPDAEETALVALLGQPAIDGAVLCTHGELLARLLPHLRHSGLGGDPSDGATEKGAAWIVHALSGQPPTLRYVPPDPVGPALRVDADARH